MVSENLIWENDYQHIAEYWLHSSQWAVARFLWEVRIGRRFLGTDSLASTALKKFQGKPQSPKLRSYHNFYYGNGIIPSWHKFHFCSLYSVFCCFNKEVGICGVARQQQRWFGDTRRISLRCIKSSAVPALCNSAVVVWRGAMTPCSGSTRRRPPPPCVMVQIPYNANTSPTVDSIRLYSYFVRI